MGINPLYLDREGILIIDAANRDDVIDKMIDRAESGHHLVDKDLFYQGILNREQVVSTGIGMGVALPHAKNSHIDHFFIIVAILKKGVDWSALDGAPVRIVFMIGGPDDKQTEYLRVLSSITEVIKDEGLRKKMISAQNPESIMKLLVGDKA
jgi:PTS system nitrogen regulatory IIA component